MATHTLSGAGVIALTSGTTRLFVEVLVFPVGISNGRAIPTNYYDVGLLRLGVQGAYYPVVPIDASTIVMDVPDGVTSLGYSLFGSCSVLVSESTPPPPPGVFVGSNLDGTAPADGASITITWGPSTRSGTPRDWIGIFKAGSPIGQNATSIFGVNEWFYLDDPSGVAGGVVTVPNGSATGTLVLGTNTPGNYDVYLLSDDTNTIIAQSPSSFNVT